MLQYIQSVLLSIISNDQQTYVFIKYSIYAIIFIIILYYLFRERKYITHKTTNKYIIDSTEIIPTVSYFSYPVETIQHIFWSGGPHSTALLCYCLIVLGQPIQPIFFMNSDNLPISGNLENIVSIRKNIIARYPHLQSRLLPTWYVTSINKNRSITGLFSKLKKQNISIPDTKLLKWDACARFVIADSINTVYSGLQTPSNTIASSQTPITYMMANTAESPLFYTNITEKNKKGSVSDNYSKIFEDKLKNIIIFPHAHMTHEEVKKLALDSKNYYWDLAS